MYFESLILFPVMLFLVVSLSESSAFKNHLLSQKYSLTSMVKNKIHFYVSYGKLIT